MLRTATEVGTSAVVTTTETLFRFGFSRVTALMSLLTFPLGALAVLAPRAPAAALRAPVAPARRCPEAELLAAFADGNLTLQERSLLEAHLARCAECRKATALAVKALAMNHSQSTAQILPS